MDTEVYNGTIPHPIRASAHSKRWIAVVYRDTSAPGGLHRDFLPHVNGREYQAAGLPIGAFIEAASDNTVNGKKVRTRYYYRVEKQDEDDVIFQPCHKDEISRAPVKLNPLHHFSDAEIKAEARRRGFC
jgi:hypothetical protein